MTDTISFSKKIRHDLVWENVPADAVLSGTPSYAYEIFYKSEDNNLTSGIYHAGEGAWKVNYTEDEFCTVITGEVHVTPTDGKAKIYRAGDSFFIPAGFAGTWDVKSPLSKFFVIYDKQD